MKNAIKVLTVSIALLIAMPAAFAQTPEVSTLPVTEPLDVGGTILQPGTYLIRLVSIRDDRNKVQITSVDRQTIYATVLTIPHDLEPGEEMPNTTFVYYPAGEGQPRALRTWFAPDPASGTGHDIVYEESRARQLARLAKESVPSYRGEETATLNVVTPEATIEPYVAPQPTTPAPAPTAELESTTETTLSTTPAMETTTPMTSAAPADTTMEMPQTASRVPLLALLGLLSLGAAVVIRFARA